MTVEEAMDIARANGWYVSKDEHGLGYINIGKFVCTEETLIAYAKSLLTKSQN